MNNKIIIEEKEYEIIKFDNLKYNGYFMYSIKINYDSNDKKGCIII